MPASNSMSSLVPLSIEEEDALIRTRITNDERSLRRLTKRFHSYASIAIPSYPPNFSSAPSSIDEARESFLVELASFQLSLRKSRMICDTEKRQADVYRKQNKKIAEEHIVLKNEIEELKTALEQAQLERRRKIEYDQIAEKINSLPSREELELSIAALEGDMQIMHDEQEEQDRSILSRKTFMDSIVHDITKLRLLGKDIPKLDTSVSQAPSEAQSPVPGGTGMDVDGIDSIVVTEGEGDKDVSEGRAKAGSLHSFNPSVKSFNPRPTSNLLQTATQQLRAQKSSSSINLRGSTSGAMLTPSTSNSREATPAVPGLLTPMGESDLSPLTSPVPLDNKREDGEEVEEGEDVEMGEVSEKESAVNTLKQREEEGEAEDREEGEASDESSVLSDPPEE